MKLFSGRATRCGLAWLACAGACAFNGGAARAAEQAAAAGPAAVIPVADFARSPDLTAAQLSPDGKFMGYIFIHEGNAEVSFLNLATGKARYVNPLGYSMYGFRWVSNERVVFDALGLGAIDRDGGHWRGLTGWPRFHTVKGSTRGLYATEVIHASGRDPRRILLLDRNDWSGERVLYPDVITMDTINGDYRQLVTNPGNVTHWLADWDGEVRFGLMLDGKTARLTHRASPTAKWETLPALDTSGAEANFVGLDRTGQILHVSHPGQKGKWALYAYDVQKKQLGESLFEHDDYDVMPPEFCPYYAGVPLAAAIYSPKMKTLLGVRYVTEGPRLYWFDPGMANLQKQIDALQPDLTNMVVSMDHEENRMLVLSWSDREPGIYSLVDLASQKVSPLGRRMPWIKPEQMAPMYPIECRARDGLPLHGYLTLPPGRGQKNLPLVMFVHGGPWVRDVWGFDPVVQFLANRGYAVLQINYRGSSGYGADFASKVRRQVGGAIQTDIDDAARWAIAQGIADARRVAIMGASYGGYSTLYGLAKSPELYRCGIAVAGVSDWPALFEKRDKGEHKLSYSYWTERLGNLKDAAVRAQLAAVSPVNFAGQIKAPLLVVHGEQDDVVPITQARKLVAQLKEQGRKPETLYFSQLGHSFPQNKDGEKFLTKLEAFLAANLKAD